ncbi:hypothetical protein [Halorarum salinum]|uniref:Uncharacterized protein n=1 Tax=Halorarum salinum TaxID=2743089 RepID=A0A7D5QIK7_9EURY|nr:hypothetical protein [Halobaculum salinum]QLG63663.1 hypothetical protein HUG12_18775 [Halobaculum salinum]
MDPKPLRPILPSTRRDWVYLLGTLVVLLVWVLFLLVDLSIQVTIGLVLAIFVLTVVIAFAVD